MVLLTGPWCVPVSVSVSGCVSRCDNSCEPVPAWPVSCRWHGVGLVLQSADCGCLWVVLSVSGCDNSCEPVTVWPVSCWWHGIGSVLQSAECVGGPECVWVCL